MIERYFLIKHFAQSALLPHEVYRKARKNELRVPTHDVRVLRFELLSLVYIFWCCSVTIELSFFALQLTYENVILQLSTESDNRSYGIHVKCVIIFPDVQCFCIEIEIRKTGEQIVKNELFCPIPVH